jgi:hypothetical protein
VEQDLAAQVIADVGDETLVEQKCAQRASAKAIIAVAAFELRKRDALVEQVRPELGDVRMLLDLCRGNDGDLRSAVEQRPALVGVQGETRLAAGRWGALRGAGVPAAVELVVAVHSEVTVKVDQHGLRARRHTQHLGALELGRVMRVRWKPKEHVPRTLALHASASLSDACFISGPSGTSGTPVRWAVRRATEKPTGESTIRACQLEQTIVARAACCA